MFSLKIYEESACNLKGGTNDESKFSRFEQTEFQQEDWFMVIIIPPTCTPASGFYQDFKPESRFKYYIFLEMWAEPLILLI